jgi:deoxyribonuclease-4
MQNRLNIGCHLSAADGYFHMGEEAIRIDANTFQFFTRNPRGSKAKEINKDDIAALTHLMTINHFAPILAHAPYTLNPCSADPKVRDFALMVMADDFRIYGKSPGNYYNFHPGSHVGQGIEIGIDLITDVLNRTLKPELETTILLETMSGKGSEVAADLKKFKQSFRVLNNRINWEYAWIPAICIQPDITLWMIWIQFWMNSIILLDLSD